MLAVTLPLVFENREGISIILCFRRIYALITSNAIFVSTRFFQNHLHCNQSILLLFPFSSLPCSAIVPFSCHSVCSALIPFSNELDESLTIFVVKFNFLIIFSPDRIAFIFFERYLIQFINFFRINFIIILVTAADK